MVNHKIALIALRACGESGERLPKFDSRQERLPFISNSGDLTRDKIAKLVEMTIDNTGG